MKTIPFCILCFIFFCQCSSKCIYTDKGDAIKIELVYKIPSLYTDDSAFVAVDSTCIYYYQRYKVYELPSRYQEYVNGELISDTPTVYYVGYDTVRKRAYKTQSLKGDLPLNEIEADSFLASRPESFNVSKVLKMAILEKSVQVSKNKVISYYKPKDGSMDSIMLYFDKSLIHIPFSYASNLDEINGSKLVRIQFNLKEDFSKNAIQLNRYRIISWEMRKLEVEKEALAIRMFCDKMNSLKNE